MKRNPKIPLTLNIFDTLNNCLFVCLFDLILYVPLTIFQLYRDEPSWVEPVLSYDKCVLLKDHNALTPVRLEPEALRSRVKHSTTEPLRSHTLNKMCAYHKHVSFTYRYFIYIYIYEYFGYNLYTVCSEFCLLVSNICWNFIIFENWRK